MTKSNRRVIILVELEAGYKEGDAKVANGTFHGFSTGSIELDVGAAHYTTAIVELDNGSVVVVDATNIRFI